jgi:hypothetical protein
MIIVDERKFIQKEMEEKGFELFDFYQNHKIMTVAEFCKLPLQRRAEVLLVDTETLLRNPEHQETFRAIINTFLGVVFFHEHSNQKAQNWVESEAAFLTKIVGEYSLPMAQLQWTMLSNQLQFFWTLLEEQKNLQKHMIAFSQELDQVLRSAEMEMARVKKIHEVLIPRRNDEIKGVYFTNRYAAGDGGGGEFYDLFQSSGKVHQIMVSSQSYLISSSLLGLLNKHKQDDFEPFEFLKDAEAEIAVINGAKKKKSEVEVIILELDLSKLTLKLFGQGKAEFYSQKKGKIELKQPYQLEKGENVIVFSPGFLFNWKETQKMDIPSFLASRTLRPEEVISELFFLLKMDQESQFLKRDATVAMMEVKRHGIHQV